MNVSTFKVKRVKGFKSCSHIFVFSVVQAEIFCGLSFNKLCGLLKVLILVFLTKKYFEQLY